MFFLRGLLFFLPPHLTDLSQPDLGWETQLSVWEDHWLRGGGGGPQQ